LAEQTRRYIVDPSKVTFLKGRSMRAAWWAAVLAMALGKAAIGQEVHKPEDWKKMYQDASAQLRAAQDRKAELAAQNAKLTGRVDEMERQLLSSKNELDTLRYQSDILAKPEYFFVAFYGNWQSFIRWYPNVLSQWRGFLDGSLTTLPNAPFLLDDPDWPINFR
jgi:hypothetical protein